MKVFLCYIILLRIITNQIHLVRILHPFLAFHRHQDTTFPFLPLVVIASHLAITSFLAFPLAIVIVAFPLVVPTFIP